ncbi:MAG: glycosyltransferase [Rhodospirillaceae bacterium]|jgi:polyisoprenyl-phosphate glycosyltransferase|nr:glycosyltransferase [Rhodospirillaceae bacterium]
MDCMTQKFDTLVSTVLVVRDGEPYIHALVIAIQKILSDTVTDYEIVVVDNTSGDGTVSVLEALSNELPNLQVYCLSAQVNDDLARIAGIQQAIGDYVILLDPYDDISQIPALLERARADNDLVLAVRSDAGERRAQGFSGMAAHWFLRFYRAISGYDLYADAPRYRLMSRRLVNFVLQHEDAHVTYQLLPMMGGFKSDRLVYTVTQNRPHRMRRSFREAASYAISLLMFTSTVPLRFVTITCGIASSASLIYSVYVVLSYFLKENVADGWTTLSLQLSVQFFLLALAIGMLAEYMVHLLRHSNKHPRFYIAREFRSGQLTREEKLNVRHQSAPGS